MGFWIADCELRIADGGLVDWWVGGLVGWWIGGLVGWWIGGLIVYYTIGERIVKSSGLGKVGQISLGLPQQDVEKTLNGRGEAGDST